MRRAATPTKPTIRVATISQDTLTANLRHREARGKRAVPSIGTRAVPSIGTRAVPSLGCGAFPEGARAERDSITFADIGVISLRTQCAGDRCERAALR